MMTSTTGTQSTRMILVSSLAALLLGLPSAARADYRVLHHFAAGAGDGAQPLGSLMQSDSVLYGMTMAGGSTGAGTIFRINADGTGFQLMHAFDANGVNGSRPYGTLIQSGAMLYGMAGSENNTSVNGAVFRIETDGTGFQVVHRFAGPPSDGKWPYDSLIVSGSTLYGMTVCGGNGDQSAGGGLWGGTVFKVNTDGTGHQILHHFRGGATDGTWSPGNLIQSGALLYGMTFGGGSSNLGTIFSISTDGTGFKLLHTLVGGSNDGGSSHSSLIQSGSVLYGLARAGGAANLGIIFRINTDGTSFQVLHSFAGGAADGAAPMAGSLVQSGSILYGMTNSGGASNCGVVFQMRTDGTSYRVLHTFTGSDGKNPIGAPFLSGTTLYGLTSAGGSQNLGVLFALDVPQPKLVPEQYPTIQAAVAAAQAGDTIQLAPGTYRENVTIAGKDVTLQASDPTDPNLTAQTIIEGNGTDAVVKLQNATAACVLAGLTIRGGGTGLWCSGGKPTLRGCHIVENTGSGIELLAGAQPTIDHCLIAANGAAGVQLVFPQTRGTSPALTNCTIVQNAECGLSGQVTLRNCILYFNSTLPGGAQIVTTGARVTYCCVQGGYTGEGNIDTDPQFARLGGGTDPNHTNHPAALWTPGDYHLQSTAACWDPNRAAWVRDTKTSPCIDAGSAADAVGAEPSPNGGRIDMGVYGGTTQASRSPAVQFVETGQRLNNAIGRSVVLADFNGDGTLDAFVGNDGDYRVYTGTGQGLFTDTGQRLTKVASASGKPAVYDFNGDGRLDVLTGTTVWINDGSAHFTSQPLTIESSETPNLAIIRLADLNGDSSPDLFALQSYAASRVYLNDGHNRFRDTGQRLGDGTIGTGQLSLIALGDIDGNGILDAITAGWRWNGSTPCPNRVWLNDGNGNYHESGQLLDEGASHIHGLDLADLNGDGRPDLIMGIQDTNRSGRIYMNDGNGHFTGGPNLGGAGGENVALTDFDGDGTLDVFVAHSTPPSRVWLNDGMGGLRDSGARLGSTVAWDVAVGDCNSDGRPDAFTACCLWLSSGLAASPTSIWLNTTPVSELPYR